MNLFKQNDDQRRIMRKIPFCNSFKCQYNKTRDKRLKYT